MKYEKKTKLYGINTASEILKQRKRQIFNVYVSKDTKNPRIREILSALAKIKVPVHFCEQSILDRMLPNTNHQGIIFEVEPIKYFSVDEALSTEKEIKKTVWVGIDSITDPMNLGSIIRSAACFKVSAIIIPQKRTIGITPAVEKSASGAVQTINIISVVNLNQTIISLKQKGFWIYGTDKSGTPITNIRFSFPLLLVLGSEGSGMHFKTLKHCDEVVSVPQKGGVESLNVSVAAGICLYVIGEQAAFLTRNVSHSTTM
jgi:23S rRNA (guanosine2251-2'-O)-methyltransferase